MYLWADTSFFSVLHGIPDGLWPAKTSRRGRTRKTRNSKNERNTEKISSCWQTTRAPLVSTVDLASALKVAKCYFRPPLHPFVLPIYQSFRRLMFRCSSSPSLYTVAELHDAHKDKQQVYDVHVASTLLCTVNCARCKRTSYWLLLSFCWNEDNLMGGSQHITVVGRLMLRICTSGIFVEEILLFR